MPPATRVKQISGYDMTELSPAGGAGVAAFNRNVDTKALAEDIRAGKVIQGVDPVINTVETQPYRKYIRQVIANSGVTDSQVARQLASNICSYVAQLPFVPSKTEIVNKVTKETEFDEQVKHLANAAEQQLRMSTGSVAVLTGPARALAKTALDLRVEDPDGSQGIAHVNDPLPAERSGEPGRFDAEGAAIPVAVEDANEDDLDDGE